MKKHLKLIFLIFIIAFIFINSHEIKLSIKNSFNLCINNVLPSVIPFLLISNIILLSGYKDDIVSEFKFLMKYFKVNDNCAFIFIMSLISGCPSNALYIKNAIENEYINLDDAQKCLNFCNFINPIFIIEIVGLYVLKDIKLGLIVCLSHILGGILVGLLNEKKENFIIKKTNNKNTKFRIIFFESISKTVSTSLTIIGVITTCIIITTIINLILKIPNNYKFLYGIIEITQGLNYLSLSSFSIKIKTIISCIIVSFGGICTHIQNLIILDNNAISYKKYLLSRLKHSLFSFIICLFLIEIY